MAYSYRYGISMFSSSLPLFDESPVEGHRLAFEQWLAEQRAMGSLRQPASIGVYRDMWGAFTAWCLGQSPTVTLDTLGLRDLLAFHAARFGRKSSDLSLSPRHALKLMRLIERIVLHRAAQTGAVASSAVGDWLIDHPVRIPVERDR